MSAARAYASRVIENVRTARDTYRIRLACPGIAAVITPGQFIMMRLDRANDPLLGRPFAVYDTWDNGAGIDVVYLVVGKVTGGLAELAEGDAVQLWGPLGNGFLQPTAEQRSIALVAGGIGQTPFLAYAKQLLGEKGYAGRALERSADRVAFYYGARSADYFAGLDDFRTAGCDLHLATDDGSLGYRGYITQLLATHEPYDLYVGCGPEPMLHALANHCATLGKPCHVSLETPMACGLGICFSCVTKVKKSDGWDYARVCVEGPVFPAERLCW